MSATDERHTAPSTLPPRREMKVALRDCRFFARHGVMEQERRAGNDFEVSLEVVYTPGDILSDRLEGTISYADLYEIVKREMEIPADLLETVAARVAESVCRSWPQIERGEIKIVKLTPPIARFTGTAEVTFSFSR